MRLENKVAVVTGSSRGIGKAIAIEFAREGCDVVINYLRSASSAREVANFIEGLGRKAVVVRADVSSKSDVRRLFSRVVSEFGEVDILVNNAGIYPEFDMTKDPIEEWDKMVDVNVRSMVLCSAAVVPGMIERGSGNIINISSVSGLFGGVGYGLTKAANIALTKGLARRLAPHVRVNSIAPGVVDTGWVSELSDRDREQLKKKIPLRRWASSEEIAKVAVFLASDESSFITGETIVVDGGDSITT